MPPSLLLPFLIRKSIAHSNCAGIEHTGAHEQACACSRRDRADAHAAKVGQTCAVPAAGVIMWKLTRTL